MPDLKTSVSSHVSYLKMGTGPVMVLLHGFPEDSNLWRNVWGGLSEAFTLLIPDLPGSGSSVLNGATSMDQLAQVVKELLDHENVSKAVIVGHSMGGYVALAFARQFPAHVAGLALVHSVPYADDEEKKINRLKSAELIRKGGREQFVKQMIPNLFADDFKLAHPQAVSEQVAEGLKMATESLINFTDAMRLRTDNRAVIKDAKFPVQWVIGKQDNIMDYKKILRESYQSAINFVTFYRECGHMSMIEAPERLATDLKTFGAYSHHFYHTGA
jgi:pimeloyl-ACP methyl ester carboxylesterase